MDVNNKLDIYKNHISDTKVAKKGISSTIDQSLVTSTEEKNIKMELEEKSKDNYKKSKDKNKKKNSKNMLDNDSVNSKKNQNIVRDPLKLLQII